MSDMSFPIHGTKIPPAIGRRGILDEMQASLTKPVPDHLQVIGARFAGKTVVLHKLENLLSQTGSNYTSVIMWDLGHQTPATDKQFLQVLAEKLAFALSKSHPEYAKLLQEADDDLYTCIDDVLNALKDENKCILIIMDGFDKPLENGKLTRSLWDQLRELAQLSSLRLITSSRRKLRELIRHPDAQTSDFWNIFNPEPVKIGCFDDEDLTALLEKLPNLTFDQGALAELRNESNGFPVLLLGLLNTISNQSSIQAVNSKIVCNAASDALIVLRDQIESLWDDCPITAKDLFLRVKDENIVPKTEAAQSDLDRLLEKGFVTLTANKIQKPCRMLTKYLDEQPTEGNALVRLFGTSDAYISNIKPAFERRIDQIDDIDPALKHLLERAIGDLPTQPGIFMGTIRGIVDRVFELIWASELPGRKIPTDWLDQWDYSGEKIDGLRSVFPQGGKRVHLLKLMTGTEKVNPRAKKVSKTTYYLVNSTQSFGDFGQHLNGTIVGEGTAYALFLLCLELVASVTRELR